MTAKIQLTSKGVNYTLCYTRSSVQRLENEGFLIRELDTMPGTMIPMLFRGAFYANHAYLKPSAIDAIFDEVTHKHELIQKLTELYAEPLMALLDEPKEDQGNANWSVI